jgi:CRISPR/Cas system-associated endonuclease Cas3-HD
MRRHFYQWRMSLYTWFWRMTAVQTVEQATQMAIDFVRKYYSFVYPIAATKETSRWK